MECGLTDTFLEMMMTKAIKVDSLYPGKTSLEEQQPPDLWPPPTQKRGRPAAKPPRPPPPVSACTLPRPGPDSGLVDKVHEDTIEAVDNQVDGREMRDQACAGGAVPVPGDVGDIVHDRDARVEAAQDEVKVQAEAAQV